MLPNACPGTYTMRYIAPASVGTNASAGSQSSSHGQRERNSGRGKLAKKVSTIGPTR